MPADPAAFALDRVRDRLAQLLPDFMVPGSWVVLDALPLTGNGKVDHAALRRAGCAAETRHSRRPPARTTPAAVGAGPHLSTPDGQELVDEVCKLWGEVLSADGVEPADDFFALGGTSLIAIRLLTRVEQAWGVRVPLPDLFAAPTAEEFAAAVAGQRGPDRQQTLPEVVADTGQPVRAVRAHRIQQAYWLGRAHTGRAGRHRHPQPTWNSTSPGWTGPVRTGGTAARRRHDALRTVVRPDGRQQVLAEVPPYRVDESDLRHLDPDAARTERERLRERMSHEVRDVSQWPLFELLAQRLDDVVTRLYFSLDLIVVDARSLQILTTELLALYADEAAPVPPLGLAFRDYVHATERLRQSDGYRQAQRYWQDRLADLPAGPGLPLLRRPEEVTAATFTRITTTVPAPDWRILRDWAAAAGITPSGLLCTAFATALAAYSAAPRFTLNLTTFNRVPVHPDVDALVGDFTATTLLVVDCAGSSFVDNARRVQDQIWRDLEHRAVSGVEVQRMLRRDPSRRADTMMPVVFTSALFPDQPGGPPAALDWHAQSVYSVSQTPQVLLDHQVTEADGALVCSWDHVAAAFPPGLVETMFAGYGRILGTLAARAGQTVHDSGGVLR